MQERTTGEGKEESTTVGLCALRALRLDNMTLRCIRGVGDKLPGWVRALQMRIAALQLQYRQMYTGYYPLQGPLVKYRTVPYILRCASRSDNQHRSDQLDTTPTPTPSFTAVRFSTSLSHRQSQKHDQSFPPLFHPEHSERLEQQ